MRWTYKRRQLTTLCFFVEVDKYTNTLFVSVVRPSAVDVLAVDIAGGRQSLYGTVKPSNKGSGGESGELSPLFLLVDYILHSDLGPAM